MSTQIAKGEDKENGQEVAKHEGQPSRFHVDYWRARLYKKSFTRNGTRHEVDEWSVRLQHLGEREAFALGSANSAVAASKAKEIATYLDANGWAPTRSKFKPSPTTNAAVCTVGEFLKDIAKRSHLKPMTLRRYAVKLRTMAADIGKIEVGVAKKERLAKFDYVKGGRTAWAARVDGLSLDILTPESVAAWRNRYVSRAGSDPLKRKSAERSAASYIRCARALFTRDVTDVLKVGLPSYPFAGVKLKDPGPQRYRSEVNPTLLLAAAERELQDIHPQRFLALYLCLWAGLRRKEADLLLWQQIDFETGQIHVRRTEYFEPKTEESARSIDLSPDVVAVLREFKEGARSEFVLDGAEANPAATYDYYRCDCTWRELIDWLHSKGVVSAKAIHSLRKESGSLIATQFGIEAAREHLGHRDIRVTSAHYVRKIDRREVSLPAGPAPGELKPVSA